MKYVDPDGRTDFGQYMFNWYMEQDEYTVTGSDYYTATYNYYNQKFANEMKYVQKNLSSAMQKVMEISENLIVAGAEFISDYGGVIAIACYASGNIGIGLIIDGITIACDISLASKDLYEGNINGMEFAVQVSKTLTITATGAKAGSNFTKAAERVLLDKKTTEILSNVISDFVSQGLTTLDDIQSQ